MEAERVNWIAANARAGMGAGGCGRCYACDFGDNVSEEIELWPQFSAFTYWHIVVITGDVGFISPASILAPFIQPKLVPP